MGHLFDTDGPLMRAMRDLMNLVILNLLTTLCALPLITAGSALAALHFVLMQMVEGTEGHIVATYFKQFKGNLKNATPLWVLLLLLSVGLYLESMLLSGQTAIGKLFTVLLYLLTFLLAALSVWIFPLTAKFVYSTGACIHNACLLAVAKLPRTLLMVAVSAVIPFVLTQDMRLLPLAFLLGISLPGYLCTLVYFPVFKKITDRC